jgi:hypothetical protein
LAQYNNLRKRARSSSPRLRPLFLLPSSYDIGSYQNA